MLKKITEPQAYYQKQGMPGMPASVMPSSAPLPFNKLPQKSKFSMKIVGGIVGLALVLAVGVAGIMTAQKQKELGNTAVAPNAPESKPAAATDPVTCRFCAGVCGGFTQNDVCATAPPPPDGYSCIVNASSSGGCVAVPTAACAMSFSVAEPGVASCVRKIAYLVVSADSNRELVAGESVPPGSKIKYVVEVNASDATVGNVTLTDTLDDNLTFVSSDPSADGVAVASGKVVTISFVPFTGAATKKAVYYATVAQTTQPITFVNTVKVTNNGSGSAGQQVAACTISLKTAASGKATCEGKTAYYLDDAGKEVAISNKAYVEPGTVYYYKVAVKALGTTAAPVNFSDILPKGIEYLEQVTPTSQITIQKEVNSKGETILGGSLGVIGSTATSGNPETIYVRYKVKMADAAKAGNYTNKASIANGTSTALACENHTVVAPPDGVAICEGKEMHKEPVSANKPSSETKMAEGSVLDYGTVFYYRVRLKASDMTAGKVAIKDVLPSNLELVEAMDFTNTSGTLSKSIDAFTGTKVFEFKVKVKSENAGSIVTNKAEVTTYKDATTTVVGQVSPCESKFEIAKYACDSGCTSDAQCKTVNNDYVCDATLKKCRLGSNTESTSCQPKPQTYACNSSCETTDNCKTVNTGYICTDTSNGKRCRLESNKSAENCQVAATPTPTPATTPTATPTGKTTVGCNQACSTNADCTNSAHICYSGACRLETNVESATCSPAVAAQPQLPQELPQTGPEDWMNWLKAGLVTLGIGAVLLLLL